jgi:hypothetical protein
MLCYRRRDDISEIVAVACEEPHTARILLGEDISCIQPGPAGGSLAGAGLEAARGIEQWGYGAENSTFGMGPNRRLCNRKTTHESGHKPDAPV